MTTAPLLAQRLSQRFVTHSRSRRHRTMSCLALSLWSSLVSLRMSTWYVLGSTVNLLIADGLSAQTVRRLALSALNSAARTKPHLIREHLPAILPSLYQETVVNPDLIRTVQMGPWTHKVDDGLEARKTAYETLYTLVSTLKMLDQLCYSNCLYSSTPVSRS